MQDRTSVMAEVVQLLPDAHQRKTLLDKLTSKEHPTFTSTRARSIFDTLLSLQHELSANEILDYLSLQDEAGNSIAFLLASNEDDRKQLLNLLVQWMENGLSPQKVVDYLLLENYAGQTIFHLFPTEELLELLFMLSKKNINRHSLDHLLLKKDDNEAECLLDKLRKLALSDNALCYRLINEDILPKSMYAQLPSLLKPLIAHIDSLPEEEKKLAQHKLESAEGESSILHQFVLTAAKSMATQLIDMTMTGDSLTPSPRIRYPDLSLKASQTRQRFFALLAEASIPDEIKFACLDVSVQNKQLDINLDNTDRASYLKILISIAKTGSRKSALAYLNRFLENNRFNKQNIPPEIFELFSQLLEDEEITANDLLQIIRANNLTLRQPESSGVIKPLDAYHAFLASLVAKKAPTSDLVTITNQILPLEVLCVHVVRKGKDAVKRYLATLENIAELNNAAANYVADALRKNVSWNESIPTILLNRLNQHHPCINEFVSLLIELKEMDVPINKLHHILCYKNNYSSAIEIIVEQARQDPGLLFDLIVYEILPDKYLSQLKNCKTFLLDFIYSLPLQERVETLISASSNGQPLQRFMAIKRGMLSTVEHVGAFGSINAELENGLLAEQEDYLPVMINILNECRREQDRTKFIDINKKLFYLANKNANVLFRLLENNLLPQAYYMALTSNIDLRDSFLKIVDNLPKEKKHRVLLDSVTDGTTMHGFVNSSSELETAFATRITIAFGKQRVTPPRAPVLSSETQAIQRVTAEKFPALYPQIYSEPPPPYSPYPNLLFPPIPNNHHLELELAPRPPSAAPEENTIERKSLHA